MTHAETQPTWWETIREAVRGTKQDLTSIPIERAIVLLAIPTVLEMSMESLLTVVDIVYVSRLGDQAIATVGVTESLLSPVYALALGLAAAATATISRRVGEKDRDAAARAAGQVITLATIVAAVLGIVGSVFARSLLLVVGAEPAAAESGSSYASLMIGGNVTIFLLFVINASFRSAGDAATAMRSLWLANILNMLVAPCLIFGLGPIPKMGVFGAAVATTGSRAVGVLFQFFSLARGKKLLPIARAYFWPQWARIRELSSIASPATLQVLIETTSWLGLVRILAGYGSEALAGYTVAIRMAIFVLLPAWGLASAAATLVGQNLGAKSPERAEQSVRTIARMNVAFLALVGAIFLFAARPILSVLSKDPVTIDYGVLCLRALAVGFAFFGFGMVTIQAFNGAGDTKTPMKINISAFWLFKIPLAFVLARLAGLGPKGVFVAITLAYAAQSSAAGILFRRGKWKEAHVDEPIPTHP